MEGRAPRRLAWAALAALALVSSAHAQTPERDIQPDEEEWARVEEAAAATTEAPAEEDEADRAGEDAAEATPEEDDSSPVGVRLVSRRRRSVSLEPSPQDSARPLPVATEMANDPDMPALVHRTEPYEWFVLPLVGYSSDVGFAGAILAQLYHYEPGFEPFRDKLQLIALLTSDLVQFYELLWERIGLFGLPLRLDMALSFNTTPVGNYCGLGNQASCDRDLAREAARSQDLLPGDDGYNRFLDRYFRFRSMRPAIRTALRWQPMRNGLELTFVWEASYGIPGFVGKRGPYPGSLYEQDFPDGEEGMTSELQIGAVWDRRDDERRPTRGYVLASSFRGAHRFTGSDWRYGGLNLGAAGFFAFDRGKRLVLATRGVADLLWGDPPTTVLAAISGFWTDMAFGGQTLGRGIRGRRYIGRIKVMAQVELRAVLFGEAGKLQGVGFLFGDVGWIGLDWHEWGGDLRRINASFGGGLGLYWGEGFVLRFDAGFSAPERYDPQFYVSLRHPF
ncbi:MAG: BamA/TamA family outer membrane protein [Sandaracinus sp.]|nr:BamA/TamA family outer membrane protein [Sandaracinus sp.]MCB9631647.1 BamA/TamA family outer membrane protein [Sandaracinus sp.]